ncbi:Carbonic anhydrase or acetyltransferase, isoleucine patch superfamily [Parafrankia irregularis]|uniref:Carbonic anhydrase or acetyltransferase, isoleucine patch superfamily n=1 Tax=Parafrankia irregularis TaxID=795642 RepID=A0A0S4QJT7_9ACTN|nr:MULTISPECIES: gamma carbonic anhydrase family protein [Parafrankia]MBE3202055.1 gamma carbonic anhydrase family protein [Parafrankia sp. CH37]CUU55831.1 Carbonic anhydrase or acetyltransferase, isoleucine patch superfamily [Parafrankia irregularis]
MAIYALGDLVPSIDPSAYVHPDATIIGNVSIGPESTVWPGVVMRGDHGRIIVGARTSIQDGTVIHTTALHPTTVGDDCVIGHVVHLEGCVIEDGSLVGSGSIVLHDARVRKGALVGAGAVVGNRVEVPEGAMALGVPAKIREGAASQEMIRMAAESYVENGRRFRKELRRID